jgi:hypothetical protein
MRIATDILNYGAIRVAASQLYGFGYSAVVKGGSVKI